MIPPSFSELNKSAKDLLNGKFKAGFVNFLCTVPNDYASISINASHNCKTDFSSATIETKKFILSQMEITNKWTTGHILTTEISKNYKYINGLKNTGILHLEPTTGRAFFDLKNKFARDFCNFNLNFMCSSRNPKINANLVLGCTYPKPYLVGIDFSLDRSTYNLKNYTFAVGYEKPKIGVTVSLKNMTQFHGWAHHRVDKHVEFGGHFSYDKGNAKSKYEIAIQYKIPHSFHSFIKGKIDHRSFLSFAYGFHINDSIQLTLNTKYNVKRPENGLNHFGLEIVYET